MRARCRDKNATGYARYGGRGISVCERWQTFASFFFDMGYRPSECHTLDRINNDGNYEPANVRWALRHEQNDNRALTAMLTIKGKTKPLPAWARENGLHPRVLRKRIASGYPEKLWLLPKDKFPRKRLPTAQPKLMLTKDGCTKSLVAWSKKLKISRPTLYDRIARGMSDEQVLTVGRVPRRF